MCGHLIESLIGLRGSVVEPHTQDGFYWVSVDGVKYLLDCNDLEKA